MRFLRPTALIVPATLLAFAILETVQAQTPTPSPTPDPVCDSPITRNGGTYTFGAVEITLPAGTYAILLPPPTADGAFALCHQKTSAVLEINVTDCGEVRRLAPDDEADAIIDAIADSCRIAPTPTPAPPPFACGGGNSVAGGQTVTIDGSIEVTLPAGDFLVQVNNQVAQICNPGEGYMLALRLSDCGRPDIEPPNAPAHEVMAQIVSSCVLLHPITPVPTVPILIEPGIITPPSTGNAGLLSGRITENGKLEPITKD